ncbi:MAG: RNA 2',3'-cyclic phosphodiesterase [Candidatus Methanoperedens sp.]|nr:RNA 2',3'-cyclic phosphodiesterase [Candidatus Methanoperedens sp.]
MIRTFIAVELPERLKPDIKKICAMLKIPGIKLVEPELVHITMKFLGDVREDQVEQIAAALMKINTRQFEANIKGIGVFPKPAYVKVIWLGAQGNFNPLHDEIERVLSPFKFEKEGHFTAHATLARVKELRDKAELFEKIKQLEGVDLGTINVGSICLKKSTLTPEGPIYETLHEIKLN